MNDPAYLSEVCSDQALLKREAKWRKKAFEEISVNKSDVPRYEDQGYKISQELVRKTRLRKEWPSDKQLENKVWLLFHKLGYPEMSHGDAFLVRIERKAQEPFYEPFSVLAKDDETVVVAQCRSFEEPTRISMTNEILSFSELKGPAASSINHYYENEGAKLKIIWIIVTHNVLWTKLDKQLAEQKNIHIVTEKELRYYLQVAEHLGAAARYQFLAEFLKNQKIPALSNIKIPAIKGKLGGHQYYSFVSTPRQLLKISFVNHRSLNDPEGAPAYQRLINKTRLSQISKFIQNGGFFPTNLLVNFTSKCRFEQITRNPSCDNAYGYLYLPSQYCSAWIIDGQHRLYGYASLNDHHLDQNIMVVAFEELDPTEEANLFVTINHEQKSVPKNLLDDLEGDLKWGSKKPSERIGAVASRLLSVLNEDLGEPLYGRITQQGITSTDSTCLTIPELKNGLRKSGLIGTSMRNNKEYLPGPLCGETDALTLERAREVLNGFFDLIRSANPEIWDAGRGGLLCTNISLQGYMLFLSSVISYWENKTNSNARELEPLDLLLKVNTYLDPIRGWLAKANFRKMNERFKIQYGSGAPSTYFYKLCQLVNPEYDDFCPTGYLEWLESQSAEKIAEADKQIKEISIIVNRIVFDTLKEVYGEEVSGYWHEGVKDKTIMSSAYQKSLDEPNRGLALENYVEFIEHKKIIERKENWPLFKEYFDIPELGEKGKTKNLKWMEKINELRRIPTHPTESRNYRKDDFEYIEYVYQKLITKTSIDFRGSTA